MFLHLGENIVVPKKNIIAIIDIKSSNSTSSKEFLEIAEDEKKIKKIGDKIKSKSFIITDQYIYLSPISSFTLNKRFKQLLNLNFD